MTATRNFVALFSRFLHDHYSALEIVEDSANASDTKITFFITDKKSVAMKVILEEGDVAKVKTR